MSCSTIGDITGNQYDALLMAIAAMNVPAAYLSCPSLTLHVEATNNQSASQLFLTGLPISSTVQ